MDSTRVRLTAYLPRTICHPHPNGREGTNSKNKIEASTDYSEEERCFSDCIQFGTRGILVNKELAIVLLVEDQKTHNDMDAEEP